AATPSSGKQIWHITAPASVPLASITQLALDAVATAQPVLSHKGVQYRLREEQLGSNATKHLLVHDGAKGTYRKHPLRVVQTFHLEQILDGAVAAEVAPTQGLIGKYSKPVRQQPQGLRARNTPLGVRDDDASLAAADSAARAGKLLDESRKRKHLDSELPLRKKSRTATDSPAGKEHKSKHRDETPEERKARREEKKRRKAMQQARTRAGELRVISSRVTVKQPGLQALHPQPYCTSSASIGDRLPEFRECVQLCEATNCVEDGPNLPLYLRLTFWDCPSECDYTCQHVITDQRIASGVPRPIVQYHGKWPFYRVLGCQELFSMLFSVLNFLAHRYGIERIRSSIPRAYPLRKYYLTFGYCGLASWTFSTIFHTRDFPLTEKLDYFGAGASVMYGMFLAVVRIFRLDSAAGGASTASGGRMAGDEGKELLSTATDSSTATYKPTVRRLWTALCVLLYLAHIAYLSLWKLDYTYNMAANVVVGIVHNVLWTGYSIMRYRAEYKSWTAWPGFIVTWVVMAMSLELLDFPPWWGLIDAHALWHLATVIPTLWWYQ
ncbi:hypothetical protein KEM52_006548, partial [Ascosphaera acerosa]